MRSRLLLRFCCVTTGLLLRYWRFTTDLLLIYYWFTHWETLKGLSHGDARRILDLCPVMYDHTYSGILVCE